MKTGVRIVPKPKPEKKVNMAVINAAKLMIRISIYYAVYFLYVEK